MHSFGDMASGLSASIDMDTLSTNSTSMASASKESGLIIPFKIPVKKESGLVIPFKIPVKGAVQKSGVDERDDRIDTPIITTPTPLPAPQKKQSAPASNAGQAAELAAKMVSENPENALKILEQQEKQDKQPESQAVAAPVMSEPAETAEPTPVAYDERQAIIQRTIALAKRQQLNSYHPLSGSLFDSLKLDL